MDQVRFGPELIGRLLDHLCGELDGCLGAGLTVWSASGPSGPLMTRGVASERERDVPDLFGDSGIDRQVTIDDLDGMGFIAIPTSWGDDGPVVLGVYLDHPPNSEDLRRIERIEPMLTMAAGVIEFCAGEVLRADQMIAMVRHRRLIEQAKGLLMARDQCAAGDAFQLLVRASQRANVKLRDLSAALVLHVCGSLDEMDMMPVNQPGVEATEVAARLWAALQQHRD